jgi:hypothetical protein
MFIQDEQPITRIGRSTGSALSLRAEPLEPRARGDPTQAFSSRARGDPETPVVEAYLDDPVVVRALVAATNEVHTWHVDGHWFRVEPWSRTSPPVSTVHLGISERYDLVIPAAGGPQRLPGDYVYSSGRRFKLAEGSWGLLRVRGGRGTLRPLPGRERMTPAGGAVCPAGAPRRGFALEAREVQRPGETDGFTFSLRDDPAAPAQPLVLHANVGDCIEITLTDQRIRREPPLSLRADLLSFDPAAEGASASGETRHTFFASPQVGQTVAALQGDPLRNPESGLYGAIIIGPAGARAIDPRTGRQTSAGPQVIVASAERVYRDVTVFLQDEDAGIGTHKMPYEERVEGTTAINYASSPLPKRIEREPARAWQRPATPVLESFEGEPVRIHVLAPSSEQAQVFALEGHAWPFEPGRRGTPMLGSVQIGGLEAVTMPLTAGGPAGLRGDYLYGNHREPYRAAGMWGIFRVRDPCDRHAPTTPVVEADCSTRVPFYGGGLLFAMFVLTALWRRRYGARSARSSSTR